jgi:formylglycine-generating enzyme required for sulfatase activity
MRHMLAILCVVAACSSCGPRAPSMGGPPLPATEPATPFVHDLGIRFVLLPAGRIETPAYDVEMRRPLLMSAHEITNKQYESFVAGYRAIAEAEAKRPKKKDETKKTFDQAIIGHTRSKLSPGDSHPVNNVTAQAAIAFCKWLTDKDPRGRKYILPDVVDWEYAARAGLSNKKFPWGDEVDKTMACYATTGPQSVGRYAPNRFGLHDVIGNVAEWVATDDFPPYELRGGSWKSRMDKLRLPAREGPPDEKTPLDHHGFRVLCEPPLLR